MNMNIRKSQGGFTLIELVIVIVILGILAAVAVPRFIDLSNEAAQAAVEGVAGGLSSGSAINYAAFKAGNASYVNVNDCTDVGSTIEGGLPTGYTITAGAVGEDAAVSCTVTKDTESTTATFQAIGTDAAP